MSSEPPISELTWEKYLMEMNQGFWAVRGDGSFNDDEVNYSNSSRIEQKRSPQWFMDGPEAALLPNKRQAVGVPTTSLFSGLLNSNVSPLGAHVSSFYPTSGHFSERLFDSEAGRTGGLDDRNNSLHSSDRVNVERKVDESLFGSESLSSLSMSHPLGDPRLGLNYGGIRKVKVSQVKESEYTVPASLEHGYDRVEKNAMSIPGAYNKTDSNNILMGLGYNKGDGNIMTTSETYDGENNVFISMGQPYGRMNENVPMVQTYKEDSTTEMVQAFNKDNVISMGSQAFGTTDETLLAVGHSYNQISRSANSMGQSYNKGDNGNISTGQSRSRGESTIISFGGYDDDTTPTGTLISSYELFTSQPSFQISEFNNGKESVNSNGDVLVSNNHIASSGTANNSRKREDLKTSKKASANTFPSNVRSLLSTGMLDGVSVKYIAWSREKELRGVIKDSGYLCGCQTCNFSKVVNAYEFERHANCKTKHPNNHIYFENGKTVYGIVQELRSTPHHMLFEVMQTITGSPINQKSFRAWKESFLAATRELQRIYGTD